MSSTSNPRVQLIDSQGDPMDSPDDNALKVKLVDTDVEITVVADNLTVALSYGSDSVTAHQGGSPWQVQSNSANLATVAKQPILGTAGSASSDVITVQGVVSMTPLLATVGHNITGMVQSIHICGTDANQISGDTACKRVDLMGNPANAGDIYVGSADNISGTGGVGGIRIQAGDFYSIDIDNLGEIWFEASEASQILNCIYYT